jgi:tryptophan synthase alpha chain
MLASNIFTSIFAQKKNFIAYLTAGQQGLAYTKDAAIALQDGGVDILEIGLPYSDPIGDGKTIQYAMIDALQRKTNFFNTLEMIHQIKLATNMPIILYSYFNILYCQKDFLKSIKDAGVDALLIVDLPLEEGVLFRYECEKFNLAEVNIISPSTPKTRYETINAVCNSFIYYVCRAGTTGIKKQLPEDFQLKINQLKASISHPIAVGFGISSKNQAQEILSFADAFVVGSYFIQAIHDGAKPDELTQLAINIDPRRR